MLKECNFPWDGETDFYLSFLQTQIVKGAPPAHFSSVVSYHMHFCYLADLVDCFENVKAVYNPVVPRQIH